MLLQTNNKNKDIKEVWNALKEFKRKSLDIERKMHNIAHDTNIEEAKIKYQIENKSYEKLNNFSMDEREIQILNDSMNELIQESNQAKIQIKRHVTSLENKKFSSNAYAWRESEKAIGRQLTTRNDLIDTSENRTKQRKITHAPSIENHHVKILNQKARVKSAPMSKTSANDKKSYNPNEVKRFIEEKKRERLNAIKELKEKSRKEHEIRELKLKELYKKQRENVAQNVIKHTLNQKIDKVEKQNHEKSVIKREKSLDEQSSNKLNNLLNENDLILSKKHREIKEKTEILLQQNFNVEESNLAIEINEQLPSHAPTPKPRESKDRDLFNETSHDKTHFHKQEKIKNICSLALDLTDRLDRMKHDLMSLQPKSSERVEIAGKPLEKILLPQNNVDSNVLNFRNMFKIISSQSTNKKPEIMPLEMNEKPKNIEKAHKINVKKPRKDLKKLNEKRLITIEDTNYNFINIFTRRYGYVEDEKPVKNQMSIKISQKSSFDRSSSLKYEADNLRQSAKRSFVTDGNEMIKEISEDFNLQVKNTAIAHKETTSVSSSSSSSSSSTLSSSSTHTLHESDQAPSQPLPKQFDISSSEDEVPLLKESQTTTQFKKIQNYHFITKRTHELKNIQEDEPQIERYSPNSLERLLHTGLNYLDNLSSSVVQLEELDKVRCIGLAQQEMVTMSHLIKNTQTLPQINSTQAKTNSYTKENDVYSSDSLVENDKSEIFEKFKSNEYAGEHLSNLVFKKILQEEKIQFSHEDYLLKLRERVIIEKAHEELNYLAKLKKRLINDKQEHRLPYLFEKERLIHETLKREQDEIRKHKNRQRDELEKRLEYLTKFRLDEKKFKKKSRSKASSISENSFGESSFNSRDDKNTKMDEKSNQISTTIQTQINKSEATNTNNVSTTKKTATSIPESINTSSDESEIITEDFVDETKEATKKSKKLSYTQETSIKSNSSNDLNRIKLLEDELDRKKRKAIQLKSDLRKKVLREKEIALKKKIQNYDEFITKAKTNLVKNAKSIDEKSKVSLSICEYDDLTDNSQTNTQTRSIRKKSRRKVSSIEENIQKTYETNFESETKKPTQAHTTKNESIEEHLNTDSDTNIDTNISETTSPIKLVQKLISVREHATEKSSGESQTYDTNFETYQSETEANKIKNKTNRKREESIDELYKSISESISTNIDDKSQKTNETSTRKSNEFILDIIKPDKNNEKEVEDDESSSRSNELFETIKLNKKVDTLHTNDDDLNSITSSSKEKSKKSSIESATKNVEILKESDEDSQSISTSLNQKSQKSNKRVDDYFKSTRSGENSLARERSVIEKIVASEHNAEDDLLSKSGKFSIIRQEINKSDETDSDSITTHVYDDEKSQKSSAISYREPKTDEIQTHFVRKLDIKELEIESEQDEDEEYSVNDYSQHSSRPPSRRSERSTRAHTLNQEDDKSEASKSLSKSQKLLELKDELVENKDKSSTSSSKRSIEETINIQEEKNDLLNFGDKLVEREKAVDLLEQDLLNESILDVIKKTKQTKFDEESQEFDDFVEADYKFDEYNELDELSQELSRLSLPSVSYKIITTNQLDDYHEIGTQMLDNLFEKIQFYNFPITRALIEYEEETNEARKTFKCMIGDLLVELVNDLYRDSYTQTQHQSDAYPTNKSTYIKKLYFKLHPVAPVSYEQAKCLIKSKLNEFLNVNKEVSLKRKTQKLKLRPKRKFDLIDYMLDGEMRSDENEWNDYSDEFVEAKCIANDAVFAYLMNDTISIVKSILNPL